MKDLKIHCQKFRRAIESQKDQTHLQADIARLFSNGQFEEVYSFIAEDAEWNIVGENKLVGKQEIIAHCTQVGNYFKSVTTDFKTFNVISDGDKVVVNGTAEFLRDHQRVSFVSACDLYEFNADGLIWRITSYCIQEE